MENFIFSINSTNIKTCDNNLDLIENDSEYSSSYNDNSESLFDYNSEEIDKECIFSSYLQEFNTKSKTRQIIDNINNSEELDRECIFSSYLQEFNTKSKTREMINNI